MVYVRVYITLKRMQPLNMSFLYMILGYYISI